MAKKENYNEMLNLLESTIETLENNDLGLEDAMKEGCTNMKTLLEVMASFGGEQVIDI